jgi:hypothetical protein
LGWQCAPPRHRAWAQGQQGAISGVVRDATGAGVPGVTITATSQATSASQTAATAGDGSYSLSIPPGTVTVTASLLGFRTVAQSVEVTGGGTSQLDFTLQAALSASRCT